MEAVHTRLAARLGHADSEYLPRILEYATSPRQARILEALNKAPEPALTVQQLSGKLGLGEEVIQQEIE